MPAKRTSLETRDPGADAERRRKVRAEPEVVMRHMLPDMRARVCHALRPLVPVGKLDLAAVAEVRWLHPRALRRHSAAQRAVFRTCEAMCATRFPSRFRR